MPAHLKSIRESDPYYIVLWENRKELLLLLLLGAILAYFMDFFTLPQKTMESPNAPIRTLTMDQIEINNFEQEKQRWKLLGDHAIVAEEDKNVDIETVTVLIYEEKSTNVDIEVTAQHGFFNGKEEKIILTGNVVSKRGDTTQLNTEKAIYDYKKGILELPEKVLFHYESGIFFGENMVYEVKGKKLKLYKVVLMR